MTEIRDKPPIVGMKTEANAIDFEANKNYKVI